MLKPFKAGDDYVVVVISERKWYRFPTEEEAWEFYSENKTE